MSAIEKPIHRHTYHIYQRSKTNINVYRCTDPDCMHYIPREFIIGKRAECPKCRELFIIKPEDVKAGQKKAGKKDLICFGCSKSPKAKVQKHVEEQLEAIFEQQKEPEESLADVLSNPFNLDTWDKEENA